MKKLATLTLLVGCVGGSAESTDAALGGDEAGAALVVARVRAMFGHVLAAPAVNDELGVELPRRADGAVALARAGMRVSFSLMGAADVAGVARDGFVVSKEPFPAPTYCTERPSVARRI